MKKTAIQIREEYKKEIEKFFWGVNASDKLQELTLKLETCPADEIKEIKTQIKLIQDYLFSRL